MAFDVSRLYGSVRGYVVSDISDARAALQPLMLRYSFDAVERDGQLEFRMRSGKGAVPLTRERVALSRDLDGAIEQIRAPEAEMDGRVRLRFIQADGDFDVYAEEAVMANEQIHAVSSSEIPIALTRTEGRQTAERWLAEARVAREAIRFALPPSCLSMGAGDVITLAGDQNEGNALYRIDRVEQGALQLVEAVRIQPDVYKSAELTDEVLRPRAFVPPAPVFPLFLDLPLIRGDETPHAPHIAVTAQPWPGTVAVYQSPGAGDFRLLDVITARSVVGMTQSVLSAAVCGRYDNGPGLRVQLMSGSLSSVEQAALLSGANLAAIGDGTPGNWEVFQFGSANIVEKDTYDLSHRLRGQLGTDATMPGVWPSGSWFVLLNGFPSQIDLSRNLRGVAQTWRIGAARRPVDDPSYVEEVIAFDGNGLRPYAPVHLSRHALSDGAMHVSWTRRTRRDGDSWDAPDVPLGEETERYAFRIIKGGVTLRELAVTAPEYSYSVADQIADGLTLPFSIEVAQISASFGEGSKAVLDIGL